MAVAYGSTVGNPVNDTVGVKAPPGRPTATPTPTTTGLNPGQVNWLTRDLLSQTEKNAIDLDLSSQLAGLLRDRNSYQQQQDQNLSETQRQGQSLFNQVAESYAARGLSSSTPYIQADDQAFQGVQSQLGGIRQQLADYLANYDSSVSDARLQAEQQKRAIEAEALQRYAQMKLGQVGK